MGDAHEITALNLNQTDFFFNLWLLCKRGFFADVSGVTSATKKTMSLDEKDKSAHKVWQGIKWVCNSLRKYVELTHNLVPSKSVRSAKALLTEGWLKCFLQRCGLGGVANTVPRNSTSTCTMHMMNPDWTKIYCLGQGSSTKKTQESTHVHANLSQSECLSGPWKQDRTENTSWKTNKQTN